MIWEKEIGNYKEAEAFLLELPKFTSKNDPDHTRELLTRMGNPGSRMKKFHVAGTNGKGSVCAYLQSLLKEYGYRTGGLISPHLVIMRERFLIDARQVSESGFLQSFYRVKGICDGAFREGMAYPTFFEFLFLMGMDIFEKAGVEALVLETGLGGRLDATNVFAKTNICVITSIGLDHCRYLGNTVEEIAAEKAGIIKSGTHVIFCDKQQGVTEVIEKKCAALGAKVEKLGKEAYNTEKIKHKSIDFSYESRYYNYIRFTVSTNAVYQVENAALALRAFEVFLSDNNLTPLSQETMHRAVADTFWEGRMEEVLPGVYFDGAHNESGMEAFLQSVKAMDRKGRRIICFSAVEDKAYDVLLCMLAKSRLFDVMVAVEMEEARSVRLDQLRACMDSCRYADAYTDVYYETGAGAGIERCLTEKEDGDGVFIVGSLYLVGLVKAVLRRKK